MNEIKDVIELTLKLQQLIRHEMILIKRYPYDHKHNNVPKALRAAIFDNDYDDDGNSNYSEESLDRSILALKCNQHMMHNVKTEIKRPLERVLKLYSQYELLCEKICSKDLTIFIN